MNPFGGTNMTWKRLVALALLSATVTAVLNCIPAFEGTSFTAPATTMEVWIVLALYIVMNCRSWKDAVLKTFAFFLISQPLIYLLEVPFKADGWGLFRYYPYWAVWTVLTIPAAAMAYRIKKGDVLSAIILSLPNAIMVFTGFNWMRAMLDTFPCHLLATLFCLVIPFVLVFVLLRQKRSRVIGMLATVAILVAGLLSQVVFMPESSLLYPLDEGSWAMERVIPENGMTATVEPDGLSVSTRTNGTYTVELVSEDGRVASYDVEVAGANHDISVRKS